MDGDGFRAALERLEVNQSEFARRCNLNLRTVQNWVANGPPDFIAPFIREVVRSRVQSPSQFPDSEESPANASSALDMGLSQLVMRANRSGWGKRTVLAGIMYWVSIEIARYATQQIK